MKAAKTLITTIAALGLCASASADLLYTFDTDLEGVQLAQWVSPGPAGWAGGPVFTSVNTAGGWTLGSGGGPYKEFSWTPGGGVTVQQLEMRRLAGLGNSRLAFDVVVDGTSFTGPAGQWFQIHYAGNSGGAANWTQAQVPGPSWHNPGDPALYSWHVDASFTSVGWDVDDGTGGWFQLFWGANSDAANPIRFYIDNLRLYEVPEPGTLALAGLGAAVLLLFRRK
jgi:hypothetical protein